MSNEGLNDYLEANKALKRFHGEPEHTHAWIPIEWQYGSYDTEDGKRVFNQYYPSKQSVKRVTKVMCSIGRCSEIEEVKGL